MIDDCCVVLFSSFSDCLRHGRIDESQKAEVRKFLVDSEHTHRNHAALFMLKEAKENFINPRLAEHEALGGTQKVSSKTLRGSIILIVLYVLSSFFFLAAPGKKIPPSFVSIKALIEYLVKIDAGEGFRLASFVDSLWTPLENILAVSIADLLFLCAIIFLEILMSPWLLLCVGLEIHVRDLADRQFEQALP